MRLGISRATGNRVPHRLRGTGRVALLPAGDAEGVVTFHQFRVQTQSFCERPFCFVEPVLLLKRQTNVVMDYRVFGELRSKGTKLFQRPVVIADVEIGVADVDAGGPVVRLALQNLPELFQRFRGHAEVHEGKAKTIAIGAVSGVQLHGMTEIGRRHRKVARTLRGHSAQVPDVRSCRRDLCRSVCLPHGTRVVTGLVKHAAEAEPVLGVGRVKADGDPERRHRIFPLPAQPQGDAQVKPGRRVIRV